MSCEAETLIERFESFVREHGTTKQTSLEKLCDTISKISSLLPDDVDSRNRQSSKKEVIKRCIAEYVASRISETYPLLSPELFSRKRWVKVEFADGTATPVASVLKEPAPTKPKDSFRWVRVDLLAKANSNGACQLGSVPWPGASRSSAVVHAVFPGSIGRQHLRHTDRAWALLHRVYADLLEHDLLAQFVRTTIPRPSVEAYWIPSLESLYVRERREPDRRDPALVLNVGGNRFLCCMWEADSEEPLEALLREFSSGGIVNNEDGYFDDWE